MKTISLLRSISITSLALTLVASASAFGLSDLKAKASSAVAGQADLTEVLALGQSLYTSLGGNAAATKYAKALMNNVQKGSYTKALSYYEKIKSANLTPDQLAAWNKVKNPISAFILEQNFSDPSAVGSALLGKAVAALKENDLKDAVNSLESLLEAGKLSKEQLQIVEGIQATL